jgi:hypothetical protein
MFKVGEYFEALGVCCGVWLRRWRLRLNKWRRSWQR